MADERPQDVAGTPDVQSHLGPVPADFGALDLGWLHAEFPASVRETVEAALSDVDAFRSRLSADLGQEVLASVLVRVARGPDQMIELAPPGNPPFAYAAAMAYPGAHLVVLSLKAPQTWEATDLPEILRHELTHLALDEAVSYHAVPLWFNEGFAIRESGELRWPRARTLWEGELSNRLLTLDDLNRSFPSDTSSVDLAYAEAADVVHFMMRDADRARFGSLIERVRAGLGFDAALQDAYGIDLRKLEFEWRQQMKRQFSLMPFLADGWMLWGLGALLLCAAWVVKKRRAAAKLAEWAREEAAAGTAAAQRRPLAVARLTAPGEDPPPRVPSVPVVEHEGRWHTLH